MSSVNALRFGRNFFQGPSARPVIPQALHDRSDAQRAKNPKPVTYGDRTFDTGASYRSFLPAGSIDSIKQSQIRQPDAGNAGIAASNAHLHVLSFSYHSHDGKEAWVQDPPADGKLKLNMALSPSSHVGSDRASKQATYEKYALSNTYNVRVRYPDGTSDSLKFSVNGKTPEYSSVSPEFEIDLNKWKGQSVVIEGWADGSSVGGYIEARKTTLHIPD